MQSPQERQLLKRARDGDEEAFDALVAPHRDALERFCIRGAWTPDDAADVMQNALLRAWRGLNTFRGESSFSWWLFQIARRELCTYHARQRAHPVAALDAPEAPIDLPDDRPAMDETIPAQAFAEELLQTARRACSAREFQVLALAYRGRDIGEIARLVGMNENAIRQAAWRARGKLLSYLFQIRSDLLGDEEAVERAFREASDASGDERLTSREREVFRSVALEGESVARLEEVFRLACMKVARYL